MPTRSLPILRRATREPLVHFLALGAFAYGLHAVTAPPPSTEGTDRNRITVTAGEVEWLATSWEKRWNRRPTPAEQDGLLQGYIRETAMYREALAMGLDRDDTIVRRRLAQKLEFLVNDLLQVEAPNEEELHTYFEENLDRYAEPALVTFTHVFIDADKRGDRALAHAAEVLTELEAGAASGELAERVGDPFPLQPYYPERDETEISKLFGRAFASELVQLEPEQWHGPVRSGYGVHLVFVHDRLEAQHPEFAAVRERVEADWEEAERSRLNDQYSARLLERYEVVVGKPEDDVAANGRAAR